MTRLLYLAADLACVLALLAGAAAAINAIT